MERLSYGSHRAATAESQLDPDCRLCLAVRCTANAGRMAPTACSTLVPRATLRGVAELHVASGMAQWLMFVTCCYF